MLVSPVSLSLWATQDISWLHESPAADTVILYEVYCTEAHANPPAKPALDDSECSATLIRDLCSN